MTDPNWAAESAYASWCGSEQAAEILRLRALVEEAFEEGLEEGLADERGGARGITWETSDAKKALDADTR